MLHINQHLYFTGHIIRFIPWIARRCGYSYIFDDGDNEYVRDIVMLCPATYEYNSCFTVCSATPFYDTERILKYCIPVYDAYLVIYADGLNDWYTHIIQNALSINRYIGTLHRARTKKRAKISAHRSSNYLCPTDSNYYVEYRDRDIG